MADWQLHQSGDDAAIYKDGDLFDKGDPDALQAKLLILLGVVRVKNDAFMLGQNRRSGIAQSVAAIEAYLNDQNAKHLRIQEIRAEIADLKAEAHALGEPAV